jgi:phosphate-selective porin OprO and OprP
METHNIKSNMKQIFNLLLVIVFCFFTFSSFAQNQNATDNPSWNSYWKKGFKVDRSDGNFKMKFGGRIMVDYLYASPDSYYDTILNFTQAVEFRRVRFYSAGTIYKNVDYKLQFDFAPGKPILKDAYIRINKIPVIGKLTIGHFKEPFGLELLTSSKYITFMERGLTNVMTPERNTGLMISNHTNNKRLNWALGYFYPSNASGAGAYGGNKFNVTARVSGTPIYKTKGRTHILHLGVAVSHQNQNNSEYKLATRPETHLSPKIVVAEIDVAKALNQYGFELAYVIGPFSVQGEYISATAQTSHESQLQQPSYKFTSYYAYVSWFLTGESRNYKGSSGAFSRVSPKKNLGEDGGAGAFELGARISGIDLDDTDIHGGTLTDITIGLNWYLNPSTRMMLNFVNATVLNKGRINMIALRAQIDF